MPRAWSPPATPASWSTRPRSPSGASAPPAGRVGTPMAGTSGGAGPPMAAGAAAGGGFGACMRAHLQRLEAHNAATLDTVAGRMLEVIGAGGVLHTAGTGHSVAMVLETFYRAGGLACVRPVFHPGLLPLSGGPASALLERTRGLAALLAGQAGARPGELAFVFSSSGANPVPVELAQCLREGGAKLDEVADHVIDTLVPPGDAAYRHDGVGVAAAPLSSLASVYAWNLLLARLVDRAAAARVDLPLWRSANLAGGDAHNADLARRYRARVPAL